MQRANALDAQALLTSKSLDGLAVEATKNVQPGPLILGVALRTGEPDRTIGRHRHPSYDVARQTVLRGQHLRVLFEMRKSTLGADPQGVRTGRGDGKDEIARQAISLPKSSGQAGGRTLQPAPARPPHASRILVHRLTHFTEPTFHRLSRQWIPAQRTGVGPKPNLTGGIAIDTDHRSRPRAAGHRNRLDRLAIPTPR